MVSKSWHNESVAARPLALPRIQAYDALSSNAAAGVRKPEWLRDAAALQEMVERVLTAPGKEHNSSVWTMAADVLYGQREWELPYSVEEPWLTDEALAIRLKLSRLYYSRAAAICGYVTPPRRDVEAFAERTDAVRREPMTSPASRGEMPPQWRTPPRVFRVAHVGEAGYGYGYGPPSLPGAKRAVASFGDLLLAACEAEEDAEDALSEDDVYEKGAAASQSAYRSPEYL